jgi:hypothetical protein
MAQHALNLVRAALMVMQGGPLPFDADERLIAYNDREPEVRDRSLLDASRGSLNIDGIPKACLLAARASRRRRWQYALVKYRFSAKLYGVHVVDLEPFRSDHLQLSRFADDHVAFSYAITAAYSAIEDLGLELRASHTRPSRINGQWNPVVKADLEQRLATAGVSLTEPLLWTIRGPKTRIQKQRQIPISAKARWAAGAMVRDADVTLVDAIAYADWLRDKIATHAAKGLTPSLSPYDVVNVQHVARRMILEVLGLWRNQKEGKLLTVRSSNEQTRQRKIPVRDQDLTPGPKPTAPAAHRPVAIRQVSPEQDIGAK